MVKTEREFRDEMIRVGRLVFDKGWVAANDGNLSARLDSGRILCTPTGISKGMMQPDDLIVVDNEGNKIVGRREATSELSMHLAIYKLRPEIRAVAHAHPPVSTGFAAAGRPLNLALLPEVIIGLGCVPLAGYGLPGTAELIEPMLPLIPKYDALLMANHGAVCYGTDLMQAYFRMETMEHFARIHLVAELLGGAKVLPRVEVDKLLDARSRYGIADKPGGNAACPLAAGEAPRAESAEEKFYVTRAELIGMVDEAIRARAGN